MKKLLTILIFLASISMYAQPKIDYLIFRGKFTTAERNLIEIDPGGAAWGWNVDTQQFEWADDSEVWQAFLAGGGAADGLGTARNVGPFTVVDADNATLNANAVTSEKILDNTVDANDIDETDSYTWSGIHIFSSGATTLTGSGARLYFDKQASVSYPATSRGALYFQNGGLFAWSDGSGLTARNAAFDISSFTSPRTITWPDKSGTVAMLDDVGGGGSGGASDPIIIVGDGATDMTTDIQTALTNYDAAYLIGDVITTSAITLGDNQRLEGPGTLTNNTTDVLVIDGTNTHIELASISSTAGHILTFTDNTFNFSVRNTKLSALNTGKSQVYVRGAVGVYDMVIEHCYFETGPNHTVPMVDVVVTAENFNENRFINNTFQTNGSPTAEVIHIETTAAAFWLSGNEVSGNLFEIPTAGAIHVYSVAGMKMHNNTVYDLPTSGAATGDMIYIDNTTGGLNSAGVTISNYHRVAGDLTTNTVYDINNAGAYAGSISVYDAVGLASSQLLFNGLSGHVVQGGYYISNYGGADSYLKGGQIDTFDELNSVVSDEQLLYLNTTEFGSSVDNRIPIFRGTDGGVEGDGRLNWNNGSLNVGSGAFNMDFGSNNITFNGASNDGFIDQSGGHGIILRTENAGGSYLNMLEITAGSDTENEVAVWGDLVVGRNIDAQADIDVIGTITGNVFYDNTGSGLTSTTIQGAIDETLVASDEADEISVAASPVNYSTAGANLEQHLAGIDTQLGAVSAGTDDQNATEVPFTPYSTIGATNVQGAIEELVDEGATDSGQGHDLNTVAAGGTDVLSNSDVTETGTASGRRGWITYTSNTVVDLSAITLEGVMFTIQGIGIDSLHIATGPGYDLYIPDSTTALGSDGISFKTQWPIPIIKKNSTDFWLFPESYEIVNNAGGDAIDAPDNQISRWSMTDLGADNSSVATLTDRWAGGQTLTESGTGTALVNVASLDGVKELEFDGSSHFVAASDYSGYDIDPTTQQITVVIVGGEITFTDFDQIINKGTTSSSEINGTFGLRTISGGGIRAYSNLNQPTAVTPANTIDVYFLEIDAGTGRYFSSSTTADRTFAVGSGTNNGVLQVGGRSDGSSGLSGSIREIAIYGDILSSGEKQAIIDAFVQSMWWLLFFIPGFIRRRIIRGAACLLPIFGISQQSNDVTEAISELTTAGATVTPLKKVYYPDFTVDFGNDRKAWVYDFKKENDTLYIYYKAEWVSYEGCLVANCQSDHTGRDKWRVPYYVKDGEIVEGEKQRPKYKRVEKIEYETIETWK